MPDPIDSILITLRAKGYDAVASVWPDRLVLTGWDDPGGFLAEEAAAEIRAIVYTVDPTADVEWVDDDLHITATRPVE